MSKEINPEVKAARYAHDLYVQRRIDIADAYTQQCAENREHLASDLAEIAREFDISPTRVIRMAFGVDRADFISPVRRALSVMRAGEWR